MNKTRLERCVDPQTLNEMRVMLSEKQTAIMNFIEIELEKCKYLDDVMAFVGEFGKAFGGLCYELDRGEPPGPNGLMGKDALLPVLPRIGYDQVMFGDAAGYDTH